MEGGGPCPGAWRQLCLSPPGILGMVELGAQSIVYELAAVVFMVSECPGQAAWRCWVCLLKVS